MSATSARHSRVKSSTIARMRKRRPSAKASDRKSRLQRWLGPCGSAIGALRAQRPLASAAPAHLQPFLAVEPAQLLVVHDDAFAREQDVQPAIAEPPANGRQFAQPRPHRRIVRPTAAVAHRCAVGSERRTRPPLAHLIRDPKVSDGLSPGGGRHHFFAAISFSMALSSIASASSFFSLAFSSSSAFSRLASDTSSPPILGLPLVERRAADPVLAAHIGRLRPGLLLRKRNSAPTL